MNMAALGEIVIVFAIALLTIAERETYTGCHGAERRHQEDQNRAADGALPVFRRALDGLITHGTTLRERRCNRESKDQCREKPTKFGEQIQQAIPNANRYCEVTISPAASLHHLEEALHDQRPGRKRNT